MKLQPQMKQNSMEYKKTMEQNSMVYKKYGVQKNSPRVRGVGLQ